MTVAISCRGAAVLQLALTICVLACIGLQSTRPSVTPLHAWIGRLNSKASLYDPTQILTMDSTPGLSCFNVKFSSANLAPVHQDELSKSMLRGGARPHQCNSQAAAAQL